MAMLKLLMGVGALFMAVAVQGQDFTQSMTAEERAAVGLSKLTAAELAALKAAVERYKAGEPSSFSRRAGNGKAIAVADDVANKTGQASGSKKGPGWLGSLISAEQAQKNPSGDEALESRLAGVISSFTGRRKFTLENGQVWQMTQDDSYAGPSYTNPLVTVKPGALGVFWLEIPEARVRVKVKPLKLE